MKKPTDCVVCSDGIMAKDGKCEESHKCTIENCSLCSFSTVKNAEVCVSCKNGFSILQDGQSSKCVA